jgi:DNA polymerase-3 subunit gamma/tau
VLGLIGRDLLFDLVEAVLDEDGPRAFALADRAVESGHDLRLVCRELTGLVRDLMIVSVDPARANEDLAETDRARVTELAKRFSREDLMRAFDVLAKAEQDIRQASQPRYHLEMALLRWMHLRKLVPLTELMEQMGGAPPRPSSSVAPTSRGAAPAVRSTSTLTSKPVAPARPADPPRTPASPSKGVSSSGASPAASPNPERPPVTASALKDELLAEISAKRGFFYKTVVAQAQRIEVDGSQVTFTFLPTHKALRAQFEQQRAWIEEAAQRLAGHKVAVVAVQAESAVAAADQTAAAPPPKTETPTASSGGDAKQDVMATPVMRDLLDVFPAEIRNVEEL